MTNSHQKNSMNFLKKSGIRRPLAVLRTLQQNGSSREKNRTTINMARFMLKSKSMLRNFGPKLFHVQFICLIVLLQGMSKVKHLKKHGAKSKLDDRSVKHILIGYDANSKGYKLYSPNNEKMIDKEEATYDFLPYFEEGDQEVVIQSEFSTPPLSPTSSIHEASYFKGS
ncbi:hypothetical protein CR513_17938, partial [Mucuna pruriens]